MSVDDLQGKLEGSFDPISTRCVDNGERGGGRTIEDATYLS